MVNKITKIYIRADGNAEIGLGHLIRCIALAQMLKMHFKIIFLSRFVPEGIKKDIKNNQIHLFQIINEEQVFAIIII